ncbi:uncharacterized protein LOC132750734 [Ruditapes philippinarum]|uniref:uncharacterized protein LOC132750734 n=1 Tax=Ruditapes philippinarum TaxID=129788 RepID=UPI00295B0449|nr:uncharacterized protein LOC132750734 [Ruditapes philippinarum]
MAIVQYSLFILTIVDLILHARGSGSLYDPPNRAVMWKYGYNTRKNYNYMQLNCGGEKQHEKGPFKCGICGDPFNDKKQHEGGGKYGTMMISRYYPAGIKVLEMPVKVELLAFEKGFFEFRLCNADIYNITQECLDENILPIKEGYLAGTPLQFFPKGAGDFRLTVAVPPNLTCNRCVLQWRYHTANSWGTDPITNEQGIGLGPQEEFRNCADIRIGGEIPKSVRDNPFFAPPDARSASAIDKPTDQRKRLSLQNKPISVKPASVDHLSLSARMHLHGGNDGGGLAESNVGTMSSGGSQSVSGWVKGTASKTKESSNRVPDLTNGRKAVDINQITTEKRTERINLMPVVNTMGSLERSQKIIQNDLGAKQQNGLFSLDNILHDTFTGKQNAKKAASKGKIEFIGVQSNTGDQNTRETGRKVSTMTARDGNSGRQLIHGIAFNERMDGLLNSGSMDGKTLTNVDNRILTAGIDGQLTLDKGQASTVDNTHGQSQLLNDVMHITSSILDSNRDASMKNSLTMSGSTGQQKLADRRIIGTNNIFDMATGAVGPAPKPEKKASIIVQGASIAESSSLTETVPMQAATRSGLSLSRDRTANQNNQNNIEIPFSGSGMFLDLTQSGIKTSSIDAHSNTPSQSMVQDGHTGNTLASLNNIVTDMAIDGSHTNVLIDKVNTNSNLSPFVHDTVSGELNQTPIGTAGTNKFDMNLQSFGSNANFGGQQIVNREAFNIGGMTTHTGQNIATGHSSSTGITDRHDVQNENPLTISALQPQDGRQRIFLLRASRPQGVILSSSTKGSNMDMTISEGIQPGTGIARKAVKETMNKFSSDKSNMATSPNNKQVDNLSIGTSQPSPDMLTNSLNPVFQSDIVVDGNAFASMTASEVIDPLRTQTQRSDGGIVTEKDFLPKGQTTLIAESKSQSSPGQVADGSLGNVINDVDAFRNELVKSSLRQSGALISDMPVAKSSLNAKKDAIPSIASTKQHTESSNVAGTSLLASNEVGGKSESNLGQTVSALLNEAEKILSRTTADISNAQTATASNSKKDKVVKPEPVKEVKAATLVTSPKVSKSAQTSHHSSISGHSGSTVGTLGISPVSEVNKITHDKTIVNEPTPLQLSLEYLLGNTHGGNIDRSNQIVDSSHGHGEHIVHVGTMNSGASADRHSLSSTSDSAHVLNMSPSIHDSILGANPSVHSDTAHLNEVGVLSKGTQVSHKTSEGAKDSSLNINTGQEQNSQATHTGGRGANVDINRHASLLSNLDIIGPDTGIVFPTVGVNDISNIKQSAEKSTHGSNQLAQKVTTTGSHSDIGLLGSVDNPSQKTRTISGRIDQSFVDQSIGIIDSSESVSKGNTNRQSTGADQAGVTASHQLDRHNSDMLSGKSTINEGRLGGNIIDFSSNSNTKRQPAASVNTIDSRVAANANDLNRFTVGQSVRQGDNLILDRNIGSGADKPSTHSSSQQPLTGISTLGTTGNVQLIDTVTETHNRVVNESVSSQSGRRRLVGGNNIVPNVVQTRPVSNRPTQTPKVDSVSIERQLNSFNLETIPGSSVFGAGVQMAGDGGMTAGFGPRDLDIHRDIVLEDRRLMSSFDRQGRGNGDILSGRRTQTSDGSFRLATDPRTGLERRVPVEERTHGGHMDSAMAGSVDRSHTPGDHSSSGTSSNPVYFLDMTGGSATGSGLIDSMTINKLPPIGSRRSLSDRRLIESRDNIIDSTRQGNADLGISSFDQLVESSTSNLGRRTNGNQGGATFDMRMEGSRSTTDTGSGLRDGGMRRQTEGRRSGSFDTSFESGSVRGPGVLLGDGTREGSRGRTEFVRREGLLDASIARSGSARGTGERIGQARDIGNGGIGSSREAIIGFTDGVSRMESNMQTDGSLGGGSARTGSRFSERDVRLDSRRRTEAERRVSGFDVGMRGSEMTSGTSSDFRGNGFRLDSRGHTGGERRGVDFDAGLRGSGATRSDFAGFRESTSRLDSRGRPRGEQRGTDFDARMSGSELANGGFREGSSRRLDSRRRIAGEQRSAEFDVRMGGSDSSSVGTGRGFRDGTSRLNSIRGTEGERRIAEFDTRMGSSGASGMESSRTGSRRAISGTTRGERGSDRRRDGAMFSARRGEVDSRGTVRSMPASSSVVPFGGPISSDGAFGPMMSRGGFPSAMSSFGGPFPPHMGPGPMFGGPGMPFDGGFSAIDPAFGPSLGGPGFLPGMGSPIMGPPSMGPGMGMPPFSPMPFGPGLL